MNLKLVSQGFRLIVLGVIAFVVLITAGDSFHVDSRSQESSLVAQASQPFEKSLEDEVIDVSAESDDPTERANRAAKNARYESQMNDRDLLSLVPDARVHTSGCGEYDPTILPTGSHDVIVLGTLNNRQSYLSAKRTAIYTEYQLDIERVFKTPPEGLSMEQGRLLIDRDGGVLRMSDGKIIASTVSGTGMARPLDVGRRYVLFCRLIHDNRDLILGYAFELRDGRAYALWIQRGHDRLVSELPGAVPALSEEQSFIEAVRNAVKHPRSPLYFSAPRD